jgi:hypothetical protein
MRVHLTPCIFIITLIISSPTMLKRCCRHHAIPKWQGRSIRKNLLRAGAAAAHISTEQDMPAADTPAPALRFMEQPDDFLDHFDGDYADDDILRG